jgi:drug/metabolite transporter (DMT)-like permease
MSSITTVLPKKNTLPTLAWIAFAIVCIIWGTTYLGVKVAVRHFPPFWLSGLRYVIAGSLMALLYFIQNQSFPKTSWADFKHSFVSGAMILLGGNAVLAWGIQFMPSGLTSIISATTPIFITLMSIYTFKGFQITRLIGLGLVLCLAGIVVLSSTEDYTIQSSMFWYGLAAALTANITWSMGAIYMKKYPVNQPVLWKTALQVTPAALFNIILGAIFERKVDFWHIDTEGWLAMTYLALIGSFLAYLCFSYLSQIMPPARLSIYTYVNTVVAVLLGWLIGEHLDVWMWLGVAIVMVGVWLVNKEYARMNATSQQSNS